jgi:hypothetical protein
MAEIRPETRESLASKIDARLQEFAGRELKDDPETLKRVASIQAVFGGPAPPETHRCCRLRNGRPNPPPERYASFFISGS